MTTARNSQEERQEISTTLSSTFQIYRGGPFAHITHSVEERMILPMEIMSITSREGLPMIQNLSITGLALRGLAQGIPL